VRLFPAFSKCVRRSGAHGRHVGPERGDRSDRRAWVRPAAGRCAFFSSLCQRGDSHLWGETARICYSVENAKSVRIAPMVQEVYFLSQPLPGNCAGTNTTSLHTRGGRLRWRRGHEIRSRWKWKPRKLAAGRQSTMPHCRTSRTRAATSSTAVSAINNGPRESEQRPPAGLFPPPAGRRVSGRNPRNAGCKCSGMA